MVSKESSHLPSANNCGYNNPEQALTVRSVLLNRDSPDIESRLKRRRNRTQQVRFKDLDDGRPECLGRCRSVDEQGSPRPTRKSPPIVLLCSSKEVHERDVRWEKTTNGSSVVGAVRGDITKTIGAVAASLARTPPHPLTPGPTRRTWVPSGPSSLTPPTNPRACLSTAIQTSPSLQKTFPFPRVQNRSHSLGDFVYSDVQEDKSDRRTFPQKHVLTSGAAQDISVPYRNSLNYFTKHHEEDGLLAGSILESVDLGHGTSLLNSSPTHTVKASMGPHHATSPLQSQKQKLVRALSDPEKSQLTSTKAPELGLADITISKPRLAGTSNLETRLTDISDPHAGMNVQSISQSRQTKSYLPHTDMTSTPLPQYELSSFINAERVPSASSPHKTSLSCASVHHTVPPNTSLSNTNPICAPAVQIALPFSCPPRPTHTTQGDESERGERREPPLPPPPTPPPPYNPRPDGYRPLRLNGRPPASNSSSEHEKKTKVPPGSSEGLHIHPKKASYCLGQDPNPPPVGSPQSVPHHNQTYLEDTSASHTETYISSPGTNNNLHLHLMDQLPPSGPWVPILNRITDTPLTPDQAETLRHVQELLGGLMSGAQSKLHLDKLLGPSGALQNVGGLQTQLQSLEGILETSQNTIKVLLDVIQDLEKKEAERDGRHSYRTGQDIENCGTCRDCACIIYSVEHDFRLQEGQFTRAWRILDPPVSPRTTPSPGAASHVEKTPPAAQAPHAVKKKMRKCFWFL